MIVTFEITDQTEFSAKTAILDPLLAYNIELLGQSNMRPLAILLHDDDGVTVIGGYGRVPRSSGFTWSFYSFQNG